MPLSPQRLSASQFNSDPRGWNLFLLQGTTSPLLSQRQGATAPVLSGTSPMSGKSIRCQICAQTPPHRSLLRQLGSQNKSKRSGLRKQHPKMPHSSVPTTGREISAPPKIPGHHKSGRIYHSLQHLSLGTSKFFNN